MSVISHLENVSSNLVLTNNELSSISTSVGAIRNRINYYFNSKVKEQFKFGSSTRDTILPRKYDEKSDIDYMVVFKNPDNYKPQTLLNWLKDFVETYYSKSEIYQSYPTVVLELLHIRGYNSYSLEKWIIEIMLGGCTSIKDYFFRCIEELTYNYNDPQYLKIAVENAKTIVKNVRQYEKDGYTFKAETEIKKLIPEL